jgi:cation diffusion facilitator family transporter
MHKIRMIENSKMGERDTLFRKGEKAAKLSAAVLLAFSVLKVIVAIISGSVALLADSLHSFADIFSSVAVWAGLKLVQRKPTERFPYGYYKAETFALLIVAITVASSGVLILVETADKLLAPTAILFPSLVLIVAVFSGMVSYFLSRYKKKVGNLIGSQSLVGEGQHSMADVYTSLLVFIGVFFSNLGYLSAEVLAGLAIGVYLIKVGLWFGKDAVLVLMDVFLSPERAQQMKEIAESVHGVRGVHDIRLRKSGPVAFGEMHIEVQQDLPLDRAHAISSEVEEKIKKRFRDVESITIHVGLAHREKIKVGIPIVEDRGLESIASGHFGNAPLFAFIEIEKGQIGNVYVKVNEAAKLSRKKGITAAQFLVNEKVDTAVAGDIGEGPFHLLNDSLVRIYYLPEPVKIEEAIRLLNQNKLEKMTTPTEKHETENA